MSGVDLMILGAGLLALAAGYYWAGGKSPIKTPTSAALWAQAYKASYGEGELLAWERRAASVREAAAADVESKAAATFAPKDTAAGQ